MCIVFNPLNTKKINNKAEDKVICKCYSLNCIQLFVTSWKVAHQAPLFMEFYRQEYWSGLSFPSAGGLSNPGIEPGSPALQADSLQMPGSPFSALGT